MKLYQKLLEIQKAVRSLEKDKDGMNFQYLTGEKLLDHIRPKMDELGLILKLEIISVTAARIDYQTKAKVAKTEMNYLCDFRFTWVDVETGDVDVNLFAGVGQNDFDKGIGSAITYAERYFIMKYFHISTDKDDADNPNLKDGNRDAAPLETPIEQNPPSGTTPTNTPQESKWTEGYQVLSKDAAIKLLDKYLVAKELFERFIKAKKISKLAELSSEQLREALEFYKLIGPTDKVEEEIK